MSKYTSGAPVRQEVGPKPRPEHCAVEGCLTHWNPKLSRHERGFADVVFTLEDGTVIARCADHYLKHMYAVGRGVHCEITGRQPDMNIDMVKAHWARLDEAEAKKAKARGA